MMFTVLDIEKERYRWEKEEYVIKVLVCYLVVCIKPGLVHRYCIHNSLQLRRRVVLGL